MSWVYYKDRKPTEEDGDSKGYVLARYDNGRHACISYNLPEPTGIAWMRLSDLLPLPKRKIRRPPTQADIDKATKPIDCWVKATRHTDWQVRQLIGIARFSDKPFITLGSACGPAFVYSWEEAEIEVEE